MKCLNQNERHPYPCGKCMACRLNRQQAKKIRLVHENQYHDKSVFVTLTYSDDNLPDNGSLVKRDIQLFLKRFRKRLEPDKVKYFCCGEYGEHTHRPHYHIIVYGVGCEDTRVFKNRRYIPSQKLFYCDCPAWLLGYVTVASVNEARCSYVAKYCTKKITGDMAEEHYKGRLPEFCLTSAGIGLEWAKSHEKRMKIDMSVIMQGKRMQIPRYYLDKVFTGYERKLREKRIDEESERSLIKEIKQFSNMDKFRKYKREANDARVLVMAKKIQKKGVKNEV